MDGRVFAHALLQTTGEELRAVYSLLFKTNIMSMMTAKTKDLFKKETDHFNESLQAEVKKLARYSDAELQVKLLTEMVRALELKGLNYHDIRDIESQSEAIVQALHEQMLKDDKEYKAFMELADEQETSDLAQQSGAQLEGMQGILDQISVLDGDKTQLQEQPPAPCKPYKQKLCVTGKQHTFFVGWKT